MIDHLFKILQQKTASDHKQALHLNAISLPLIPSDLRKASPFEHPPLLEGNKNYFSGTLGCVLLRSNKKRQRQKKAPVLAVSIKL
jgi:hypothetical protein